MGRATALFFGSSPWIPKEGPKGQISLNIIKFQFQSQFQRFLNQTLCVFSQMKDIKHIRRDFHLATWVMPQGWDLGVPWGLGGGFFSPISARFGVRVTYMNATNNGTIFWVPAPWGLGERPKGQISLNLNYKSISKIFKPNFVHLLTNERYITYQAGFSFAPLDHARGGTWLFRGGSIFSLQNSTRLGV